MPPDAPAAVVLRAPAKINLYLAVLGRRADGYHELLTVFQSLALADHITLRPADRPGCTVRSAAPALPAYNNLCLHAAHLLAAESGTEPEDFPGVEVFIEKRLPLGAGLGGGSSDGAVTLRALNAWWELGLRADDLLRLACLLGADVPYFLHGGTARGTGRGDIVEPLPPLPPLWVVLAMPEEPVATADAFRWWDEDQGEPQPGAADPAHFHEFQAFRAETLLDLLRRGDLIAAADCCVNDLEAPVTRRRPDIAALRDRLREAGCPVARLTGAGAAVFGLAPDERTARAAAERVDAAWVSVTRTDGTDE